MIHIYIKTTTSGTEAVKRIYNDYEMESNIFN